MSDINSVEQLLFYVNKFHDPQTPQDTIKKLDKMFRNLRKNKDLFQFVKRIFMEEEFRQNEKLLIHICKSLKLKLRKNFNELQGQDRLQFYEFLLQFICSQYCKRSIEEELIDCINLIFARIWNQAQDIFKKTVEVLQIEKALIFLQKIPLVVLQRSIIIEKKLLQEYEEFIFNNVFPYTIQIQNQTYQQIQNFVSTQKILVVQRNYEILEFWVELFDTKEQAYQHFETSIINNPFIALSFNDLKDIILCDSAQNLLLQISLYLKHKKITTTNFFAMIDHFLQNLNSLPQESYELIKIMTYFFDYFFDKISNKEKLFMMLIQSLDQQPTLQALRGFQKFLQQIKKQKVISNYQQALDILWKQLPKMIKLEKEDLQKLSEEFKYNSQQESFDDSFEDKLQLRKCSKNLFSQYLWFLNDIPILDFIYNEINNLQDEESYEALLYILCGILKNCDQLEHDYLSKNNLKEKILTIFFQLCSKSSPQLQLRTKYTLRKLMTVIINNNFKEVYTNQNFIQLLKFNDLQEKNLSSVYRQQTEQVIKCLIKNSDKQFFMDNIKWFIEVYDITKSKQIIKQILQVSEKVQMQQIQLEYFKQIWNDIENKFNQNIDLNYIIDKIELLSLIIDNSNNQILNFNDWKVTINFLVQQNPQKFSYQEVVCEYFTKYIKKNPQVNISSYKEFLDIIIQYFQLYLTPSYLFIFEQILKHSYKEQDQQLMQQYYNKICSIILQNFEGDNFDGKYYTLQNQVKMSIYDKFIDINKQSLITFEDLFDDFYGVLRQFQRTNNVFIYNYSNAQVLLNFSNKIFRAQYIYNIPMIISFIKELSTSSKLIQHQQNFWKQIYHKCFNFLFEEYFDSTTTRKIFQIICAITDELYPQIIEQDLQSIFEKATFLTSEIKEYFFLMIKKCKLQKQKISLKNEDIKALYEEFREFLQVNAEENYEDINQFQRINIQYQILKIIKTMKSIIYLLIIFQAIYCGKRVITEARYQEILEANMKHLPELVISVDYRQTIEAIQRESFELFGTTQESNTIQDALRNYYYADLDQISLAYKGLDSEELIQNKFYDIVGVQVKLKFSQLEIISEQDIKDFYVSMIPFVKIYNTALIRFNIQMQDSNFVTDAKISSIMVKYIQNFKRDDLLKKMKPEEYKSILNLIEIEQDLLEQQFQQDYIPRAVYYIQIRIDQLIDFSYKIRIMAYDISRNSNYPKSEHNEEEVMKFQYLIKRSKTILEIFLEANDSGNTPHSLNNPDQIGSEQEITNRKRKDYLFQTIIEEKEYIMQQENNTLMSKYYGQFLASLQKVVQRKDDNPQDAFYIKKYMSYQNEILPPDDTFQNVLDQVAEELPQKLQYFDHYKFFDQQVILLQIADQLAYNKNFTEDKVKLLRDIYPMITSLPLKYFENKSVLFFINKAGCFGDLKVNKLLYNSICQFRLQYTVEQTTTNKYAVGRFLETFIDNQYQNKKEQQDEMSQEFSNLYFYLKFQLMFNIAGFVPQNVEGKYFFQPITDQTIQFIDQNINSICVVNKGGDKLFLKRVYLITSDLMKNNIRPKMQLQMEYITNRNVEKENQVYVDLRQLSEMFKIQVSSAEVLDQQIIAKIDKPDEFIINAQFDEDTFQRTFLQGSDDEEENEQTFHKLSTLNDKTNQTFNIGRRTGTNQFRPNQTVDVINVNDMSTLLPVNNIDDFKKKQNKGKNGIKVLKDKQLTQIEQDLAEDPNIIEMIKNLQNKNGGKAEIQNPDGSITRLAYVQVVPKKSPCFEKLNDF